MEPSVLRRYFPSFHRMADFCGRAVGGIRRRFTWAWVKLAITLGVGALWIVLWVDSHTWRQVAGEEFAVAVRGAGLQAQATSFRPGTLNLVLLHDYAWRSPVASFRRLTYLGNGGYAHGYGFELPGFAFSVMPRAFHGGDYGIPPYVALEVPYWFLTAATGLLALRYARRSFRPRPGISTTDEQAS